MCELLDSKKVDMIASQAVLHEVRIKCQSQHLKLQKLSMLKKVVDDMSIFAGRNPIVSVINSTMVYLAFNYNVCNFLQNIADLNSDTFMEKASQGIMTCCCMHVVTIYNYPAAHVCTAGLCV